ncbi:hypothetical protein CROQUDRAFT_524982 [Cronartium quercuum f. sp. fusiforme G11]|uniref:RRN6 K-rich C-terminal domain-containing protein n=1 Tax=Cronartium quercuum f. sp. fusiforme G11 TaxID=708437 RepID=A0A9P6NLH8_9BASI|nr:hypothetical protein CROQUDRAFT_524982 [Cronartium quercuum f. sp. fusiforme G11]
MYFVPMNASGFIYSQHPLLKTFPASIENAGLPRESDPYRLLVTANRFLRKYHPQVDLPKELLLSHLLEDQEQQAIAEATSTPKLASCVIEDQSNLLISVGGRLSTELYCSAIRYEPVKELGSIPVPRFHATLRPSLTFSTPILQLTTGPFTNFHHPTLCLARTFQSTYFFISSQLKNLPSTTVSSSNEASDFLPRPRDTLALAEVTASATDKTTHVDACVGQDQSGSSYGVIVDRKGGLWKTSEDTDVINCLRLGTVKDLEDNQLLNWARCGITPVDGCIIVGLRKSITAFDPRTGPDPTTNLYGPAKYRKLYNLEDNHLITDIQRYPSRSDSHLRFISTTQSLICLDDRTPGIPLLTIPHYRAHDLTLNMSFPSEFAEGPGPMYLDGSSTNQDSSMLLWSPNNDATCLYPLTAHSDRPPNLIGYPLSVPVLPTQRSNSRCGLVFTTRSDRTSPSKHMSIVEMTKDGALWHQVLSLEEQSKPAEIQSQACSPSIRCVWDQELFKRQDECENASRSIADINTKAVLPTLSAIFQDFLKPYTSSIDGKVRSPPHEGLPNSYLTRPLEFAAHLADKSTDSGQTPALCQDGDTGTDHQPNVPASKSEKMYDLTPTLRSLLYSPNNKFLETAFPSNLGNDSDKIDYLIAFATRSSLCTTWERSQPNPTPQVEIPPHPTDNPDLVDRLMGEWTIGIPTSQYEWKDILINEFDDNGASMGFGSSRRQSPMSQISMDPRSDYDFSDAMSKIEVKSSRKQPTTPGKTTNTTFTSPSSPFSQLDAPSASLLSLESCPTFAQSQTFSLGSSGAGTQEASNRAFSQILPGPHGDRTTMGAPAKKKKRMGGF